MFAATIVEPGVAPVAVVANSADGFDTGVVARYVEGLGWEPLYGVCTSANSRFEVPQWFELHPLAEVALNGTIAQANLG